MQILVALMGILAVAIVLRDSFETIILPRRVSARFRVSKIFYRATWKPWKAVGRRLPPSDWRETFLSTYGPLSLIGLFVLWGGILIAGFSALLWAAGFDVNLSGPGNLYVSGTTFTTLGIGDFTPHTDLARFISMVDEWAGSPPSAGDLLRRAAESGEMDELIPLMGRYETWTAELLESHLSYQVLSYFRSQHENQSWVAALTAIMDF